MHEHILINHDTGLFIVVSSKSADIDLVKVIDDMILSQICHATEGIQET